MAWLGGAGTDRGRSERLATPCAFGIHSKQTVVLVLHWTLAPIDVAAYGVYCVRDRWLRVHHRATRTSTAGGGCHPMPASCVRAS